MSLKQFLIVVALANISVVAGQKCHSNGTTTTCRKSSSKCFGLFDKEAHNPTQSCYGRDAEEIVAHTLQALLQQFNIQSNSKSGSAKMYLKFFELNAYISAEAKIDKLVKFYESRRGKIDDEAELNLKASVEFNDFISKGRRPEFKIDIKELTLDDNIKDVGSVKMVGDGKISSAMMEESEKTPKEWALGAFGPSFINGAGELCFDTECIQSGMCSTNLCNTKELFDKNLKSVEEAISKSISSQSKTESMKSAVQASTALRNSVVATPSFVLNRSLKCHQSKGAATCTSNEGHCYGFFDENAHTGCNENKFGRVISDFRDELEHEMNNQVTGSLKLYSKINGLSQWLSFEGKIGEIKKRIESGGNLDIEIKLKLKSLFDFSYPISRNWEADIKGGVLNGNVKDVGVVNMVIDGSFSSEEFDQFGRSGRPVRPGTFAVEFCLDGKCVYAGFCTEDSCNTKENILKTLKSAEEAIEEFAPMPAFLETPATQTGTGLESSGVSMKGTFISMALSLFVTFVFKSLM